MLGWPHMIVRNCGTQRLIYEPRRVKNRIFVYAKTKAQISFPVRWSISIGVSLHLHIVMGV